ncbi:type III-A CRISPR-associated protein Csm2 [Calidifontibacillus erzurumensis]|uniref:CRISPR system Cms protein Csm2 n=1 Tax=Calidifontibacillus erzurumensis TaxID=2741433 RepID=A0A8J8GGG8_9BACI|nr:type III-A CRISPR-associated protein Csm2 [Calidifontibacillus erzurumensis]NSL53039.1 type III-A CRISPR-associated protein Csm2 [Calidifontibacillus erzurumensis]
MSNAVLKSDYLKNGYFDENMKPKKEIYIEWAQYIADEFAKQGVTRAALRRFYGQVKGLQPLLKNENLFMEHKHRLYPINPLANYQYNREENGLPYIFVQFFEKNLKEAEKSHLHFQAFIDHFQSIIAYFRGK